MATTLPILEIQEPGTDLARKTVFIKLHLGLLGNSRKVSSSQVEVDADKELIRVAKTLLDSPELQAIRTLDGERPPLPLRHLPAVRGGHSSSAAGLAGDGG